MTKMRVGTVRCGEKLVIGDVSVQFERISGHRVKVAVDAPENVKVVRGELERRSPP